MNFTPPPSPLFYEKFCIFLTLYLFFFFFSTFSAGAKGELADLLSKMDKKSLRFLPAAQVATLRRAQLIGLPRNRSVIAMQDHRFHVHFGAGKLGLGLMIPAVIDSNVCFAVIQRASKDFESLKNADSSTNKTIELMVNSTTLATVGLITCLKDLPADWLAWLRKRKIDSSWPPPKALAPKGLFVLSDDPELVDLVKKLKQS
jgi:hypothetical protein